MQELIHYNGGTVQFEEEGIIKFTRSLRTSFKSRRTNQPAFSPTGWKETWNIEEDSEH